MNVFVDANVLISVLNKEYPFYDINARILSLQGVKGFRIFTSPVCLAIAFYFARKKNKRMALTRIQLLCSHLQITGIAVTTVQKTTADKRVKDFEDGLEYYAAIENNCRCILLPTPGIFIPQTRNCYTRLILHGNT